jgi:hypothetical protein
VASTKRKPGLPSVRRRADDGLVKKVLTLCDALHVWAWRMNSGLVTTESGSKVQLSPPGTPDVFLIVKGKPCFLECKKTGGRMNKNQLAWAERATEEGVRFACVESLGDARYYITEWMAGR